MQDYMKNTFPDKGGSFKAKSTLTTSNATATTGSTTGNFPPPRPASLAALEASSCGLVNVERFRQIFQVIHLE